MTIDCARREYETKFMNSRSYFLLVNIFNPKKKLYLDFSTMKTRGKKICALLLTWLSLCCGYGAAFFEKEELVSPQTADSIGPCRP